jgi:hypothetical protein
VLRERKEEQSAKGEKRGGIYKEGRAKNICKTKT